ncbi:proteasome activator complex subunit 2 [Narcine bancroftii]|uniref:proteasome activator complex subunit 2 n=1 Tax=Narcine bancroftii TaxID=1343680 RepID=UPI0038317D4D
MSPPHRIPSPRVTTGVPLRDAPRDGPGEEKPVVESESRRAGGRDRAGRGFPADAAGSLLIAGSVGPRTRGTDRAMATVLGVTQEMQTKVENFKDQICNDAVLLVSKHLPNKLAELDNLLRAEEFNLTDLSQVHVELDIPIPDPPKDDEEEGGKEKKKKKRESPKCGMQNPNEKIVALVRRVKPELSSMKETCIMLSTWITYLIPKIEDGNDFGVAVQEKVLERIAAIKTKVEGFQTSITKYFTERGDTVAKASKDTHVMDYRQLVHEKDEAAYLDIKTMIMDIRGYYIELLELIVKNVEKVTSPKGEEKSYSMY